MAATENKCRVCGFSDFEYDENHFRNVCLKCNTMQEITGIAVATFDYNTGINFSRLNGVTLSKKITESKRKDRKSQINDIKPFKLEDMFHWIFELQIEAMQPFVTDFEKYKTYCECLWTRYMKCSGSTFELEKHRLDDLRIKKYPLGWGVPLNPNKIDATLNTTPKVFYSKIRKRKVPGEQVDTVKITKNAKKLKIEKMVKAKFRLIDEKADKGNPVKKKEELTDEEEDENSDANSFNLEFNVKREELRGSESESEESELSDEEDESFINLYQFSEKEQQVVRVMRRKKEQNVRYTGGRVRSMQLLMENNLLLLFYSMFFARLGTEECCCLMDVWRLAKRGDIPFIKIGRFLPTDRFFMEHCVFQSIILRDAVPRYHKMKVYSGILLDQLQLHFVLMPDNDGLVRRLLRDLNLPQAVLPLVDHIRRSVEATVHRAHKLKADSDVLSVGVKGFNHRYGHCVLYPEVCCLAYVFMALRVLVRLDGAFEREASAVALEIERLRAEADGGAGEHPRLFIWTEWMAHAHRGVSMSTARTWRDLRGVGAASAFYEAESGEDEGEGEGEEPRSRYTDRLARSRLVNSCGRFVSLYRRWTEDETQTKLVAPLLAVGEARRRPEGGAARWRDYRAACVEYLADPAAFRDGLDDWYHSRIDGDSVLRRLDAPLDRLAQLCRDRPMGWRRLPLHDRHYPAGVFSEVLADERTSDSEHRLLDVLTHNTGIDRDLLHSTVRRLVGAWRAR